MESSVEAGRQIDERSTRWRGIAMPAERFDHVEHQCEREPVVAVHNPWVVLLKIIHEALLFSEASSYADSGRTGSAPKSVDDVRDQAGHGLGYGSGYGFGSVR
jgi:hypothetical protein